MPEEISPNTDGELLDNPNVHKTEIDGKTIYLIGTAHVSPESVELVKRACKELKPDSICIELDEARYNNMKNPKKWEDTDLIKVIKSKRVGFLLAQLILGSYQKKIAGSLNSNVGGEMIAGIECAEEQGANLVLADRDLQVTFMRIWRKMSFFRKLKLILSLIFSFGGDEGEEISEEELKELMQKDLLDSALSELKQEYPEIGEILIDERDAYLAYKIKNAPGNTVAAVLGAAHIPGIKSKIESDLSIDEISEVPKKQKISKVLGWIIPIVIIGLLVYAFTVNISTGLRQLSVWVLWNSLLAGIGALCALANPLSILTAALVAPFTSVNPLLACGWFAGLVEANVSKPRVKDLQNLSEDVLHFKSFYRNRFLKTLLVVIFSNIGSTVGTIVAGLDIVKNLF